MKALILAHGTPPSNTLLRQEWQNADLRIAVDGGANYLHENDLLPDLLIGDLDSIELKALQKITEHRIETIKYPSAKDNSDSHLALNKALEHGATNITLLGCTGKRIDHLLSNIGLLAKYSSKKVTITIKDDFNTLTLLHTSTKISGTLGTNFSLQAYSDIVKKLTIIGSKFTLENYDLKLGDDLTISNEFLENAVEIQFESGKLLLIMVNN
jgi:thiamine pyrophosphokinase